MLHLQAAPDTARLLRVASDHCGDLWLRAYQDDFRIHVTFQKLDGRKNRDVSTVVAAYGIYRND